MPVCGRAQETEDTELSQADGGEGCEELMAEIDAMCECDARAGGHVPIAPA